MAWLACRIWIWRTPNGILVINLYSPLSKPFGRIHDQWGKSTATFHMNQLKAQGFRKSYPFSRVRNSHVIRSGHQIKIKTKKNKKGLNNGFLYNLLYIESNKTKRDQKVG
jgi:hypothetical protein